MSRPPSAYALSLITCALWCMSSGQFIEKRWALEQNVLFWPLWISVSLIIWLALIALDNWWEKGKRRGHRNSPTP